jgi:Flp pilus assembly protein TadD
MGRVGITTAAVAALVAVSTGTSTALPMPALPAFLQATETRDQTFARRQAAAAHVQAGIELLKEHKVDEAEQRFRQAIALAPEDDGAHGRLAWTLLRRGRWVEAEAACREAVLLNPEHALWHGLLGRVLQGQRRLADAEAAYREALRLAPRADVWHGELARTLNDQKRWTEGEIARAGRPSSTRRTPTGAACWRRRLALSIAGPRPRPPAGRRFG